MFILETKPDCPYCEKAKSLLELLGFDYSVKEMETEEDVIQFKENYGSSATFPRIHRQNGNPKPLHIGGYDDLVMVLRERINWW